MVTGRHAPPGGSYRRQEPVYDVDIPTPSHAERARTLLANANVGTLCTLSREPAGYPYGSFVTFGLNEGHPIFLISALAEHTRNLLGEGRCSLLVTEDGDGDPLARGRVTLVGRGQCLEEPGVIKAARDVFLEAHPNAAYYADFKDFSWWEIQVESIRYIGGYGRMSWIDVADWREAQPDPLRVHAARIVEHMNEDHADTMVLYCRAFTRATEIQAVRMTGVDQYGFEMSAVTAEGPRPVRLPFEETVSSANEVRQEMVRLAEKSRLLLNQV